MKRLRNILVTIVPLIILFLIADYVLLVPLNIRFEEGFNLFFALLVIAIIAYFYEDVRYIFQDLAKGQSIHFPGKAIKFCVITLFVIYIGLNGGQPTVSIIYPVSLFQYSAYQY